MTVLIAENTPPAVRGMLKRWFIEPRPNVFVGSMNPKTRDKALAYIRRHALGTGWLVIMSEPNCQGFSIQRWGETSRQDIVISGLHLIAEKVRDEGKEPF